jgi:hypothetical protein
MICYSYEQEVNCLRVGYRTTLEENLILAIKIRAIELHVDANDILEELIRKYLNGETQIEVKRK